MKANSKAGFVGIWFAAVLSGGAALAYEISWSRMLVVPLGNSNDATAIVLTAFMLGMAGGAKLLGNLSDRVKSPLRLYAGLEIGLGLLALPMPLIIQWLTQFSLWSGGFANDPAMTVLRYALFGLLVAIPSIAMGATLPVLTRALSSRDRGVGRSVGIVYGVNTVGAALGAMATGFFALPSLGIVATSSTAVSLSIMAGLIAVAVDKIFPFHSAVAERFSQNDPVVSIPANRKRAIALVSAAVSGFMMLGAEVLFARVLTFIFGHDTYAFAVLLSVVLVGLAIGGLLHAVLAKKEKAALVGVLLGLFSLALIDFFWIGSVLTIDAGRDPFHIGALGNLAGSLWLELIREILFTPILVLVPAILAGATFPAACALYADGESDPGGRIGTVAWVNGLGAAGGALFVSFVLVGAIGIEASFIALALLGAIGSVFVLWMGRKISFRRPAVPNLLPALITLLVVWVIPADLPKSMLHEAVGPKHQKWLHYEEGRTGTVSVTVNEINGEKQLFMNAVNEVTTRLVHDQSFKLLGHLGPLLHPRPEHGLMICFGAGLSAGAALVHPLKTLDVVELSSAIPGAAHLWAPENNGVLNDPRFRLHIADGRHFLAGSNRLFDTITVDSTHPKAVDSWLLYTREFYQLMKDHLADGGIAVQWVPLHGLSEREFKIIVRTFRSVFRETTLWVNVGYETYGQAAYLKMMGTTNPLSIDYKELAARLAEPRIRSDLAPFGMDAPEEILDSFLAGPSEVADWTQGVPIQTDNHPILPYTTHYSKGRRMTAELLLGTRSSVIPILENLGPKEGAILEKIASASKAQGFLLAGRLDRALSVWKDGKKLALFAEQMKGSEKYYAALAKRYPNDPTKWFEIGSYLGNLGYVESAERLYRKALTAQPNDIRIRLNLGILLMDRGETERSVNLLRTLALEVPGNSLVHYNLGVALLASGQPEAAVSPLRNALKRDPHLLPAKLSLAEAFLAMGKLDRAESQLREVVAMNRWFSAAWNLLGRLAARKQDFHGAKNLYIQALELSPYRAESHYNLGIALQELGQIKEAAGAYRAAIEIEPADADAHNNLGLVYAAAGMYDFALTSHLKALDLRAHYPEAAFNTGLVYKQLGNPQKAAEFFSLALELSPTLFQAKQQLDLLGADAGQLSGIFKE